MPRGRLRPLFRAIDAVGVDAMHAHHGPAAQDPSIPESEQEAARLAPHAHYPAAGGTGAHRCGRSGRDPDAARADDLGDRGLPGLRPAPAWLDQGRTAARVGPLGVGTRPSI
ncbi:protein of unknown function (plasmid) [Cupriavidus taiwanensis]|uniref:Uncharacterized protein n=1 Tax=Cupriavidus taiwanensis TaxID=164546 RepID=A0A9Q7XU16_9BURK|nr:protein of unknown function [Cupriavidus taiwanensis]